MGFVNLIFCALNPWEPFQILWYTLLPDTSNTDKDVMILMKRLGMENIFMRRCLQKTKLFTMAHLLLAAILTCYGSEPTYCKHEYIPLQLLGYYVYCSHCHCSSIECIYGKIEPNLVQVAFEFTTFWLVALSKLKSSFCPTIPLITRERER